MRLEMARFAGGFGVPPVKQFRSQLRNIWPLDGKPSGSDAPAGFDRLRERSSGGQSDHRSAPKEQPPPETLRQKDRIG